MREYFASPISISYYCSTKFVVVNLRLIPQLFFIQIHFFRTKVQDYIRAMKTKVEANKTITSLAIVVDITRSALLGTIPFLSI